MDVPKTSKCLEERRQELNKRSMIHMYTVILNKMAVVAMENVAL